jgi:ABC-type Fe3+ transport system permease subunit
VPANTTVIKNRNARQIAVFAEEISARLIVRELLYRLRKQRYSTSAGNGFQSWWIEGRELTPWFWFDLLCVFLCCLLFLSFCLLFPDCLQ